ncbi:alpha/beta fold hydrolase [Sporichthya polymorpha]|uniref:alpha/beta fold hydrolase n=1 Tax=Sporichthya polymorpha TaxID=35751 RepID=UPI000375CF8E|nr:alpha/beta hydrolase [Sporichthya polymorpha]
MPEVIANGVRFHVQHLNRPAGGPTERTAPPVVFLHGLGMDNMASFYYTVAGAVGKTGAECVLYDLRGHGDTERPRTGYTMEDSIADLTGVLDALEISTPVHLVGNSYGGTIALDFAVEHPERVASLVLIEAHFNVDGWAEQIAAERQRVEAVVAEMGEENLQAWIRRFGRKVVKMMDALTDLANHTSFYPDLTKARPIERDRLRSLRMPIRAIYGEKSDVPDYQRQLEDLLPHATLTVVEGVGHSVLMDATPQVREIVVEWLAARAADPCLR